MPASARTTDRNDLVLAGLCIAVGLPFLIVAQYKVFGTGFTLRGGFESWIHLFLDGNAYPPMVAVLRNFVLPHSTAIAFLVAYGELAIGLAVVLGVLVRAASLFWLVYVVAVLFASNYPGPHVPLWRFFGASLDHSVLALCFLAFALGDFDRRLALRPEPRATAACRDRSGS